MNKCEGLDLKNHIIVLTTLHRGGRNFLCCKLKGTPGLIGQSSSSYWSSVIEPPPSQKEGT